MLNGRSQLTIESTVNLVAGSNEFTAYAFNNDNVKSADSHLRLNGAASLRRAGTAYLIAVGVGNYENPRFNLEYSVADANAIAAQSDSNRNPWAVIAPGSNSLLNRKRRSRTSCSLSNFAAASTADDSKESPASLFSINHAT